ncbi:hypothetical protein QGN23_07240 [Chryseobacterium gotjawalense]|uniref:Glycosyl transferase family 1 domain-containing protein n=1 Tax=Chryseobacterium gotjawalense TaxID=3042315 RepID=A0ABY8RGQ4_9FLAO|nr:hypothetical protein [Chryseobacterium sp. wdc7]WHF53056.1 hypothetical protein QGN23_07240 [Chryseobacterium sp. wdc7]
MIIAAELQMQGNKHIGVNSSMLKILADELNDEIIIFCDTLHKDILAEKYEYNNISWRTFKYSGEFELKKIAIPLKVMREVFLSFKIFILAHNKKSNLIFFFSSYPFTQFFLNIFSFIFNQKIIVCQHGDLGVLSMRKPKILSKIFGYAQRFFFNFRFNKVIVLFYGESVRKLFFSKFKKYNSNNVISIDHPYNFRSDLPVKIKSRPIKISGIGTGLINKNSQYIYKLAKLLEEEIKRGEIIFQHIGNISPEVLSYRNGLVIEKGNKFMDYDIFKKELNESDFFIYFFEKDTLYDLCPSGTFFDAIKYQKPILAIENPFFSHYFEKLGDIGFLAKDLNELKDYIAKGSMKNDNIFLSNLENATYLLDLKEIGKSFKIQFDEINN